MTKLADNMRQGLESELAGLEGRLAALGDDKDMDDVRENLRRRVGEVNEALGKRGKSKTEKRPATGTEKRPG